MMPPEDPMKSRPHKDGATKPSTPWARELPIHCCCPTETYKGHVHMVELTSTDMATGESGLSTLWCHRSTTAGLSM